MRLTALEIFLELSQAESIRQLARARGVKPSVISRQIESVEHFFRADLFERNVDGIKLTQSGRLLADRANPILADIRVTRSIIDDIRGLHRGEVIVYAGGAPAAGLLAPVVADLHGAHPGLHFQIHVASAGEVFTAVADGIADLGFTMFSPKTNKVDIQQSKPLEHSVIVAPGHSLAELDRVSLGELASVPLALPDLSYGLRRRLERLAADENVDLEPHYVSSSLEIQKELAVRGVAALVLPAMCCRREIKSGILRAIPFKQAKALATSLDLCRAHSRKLPFAARRLMEALVFAMQHDS